MTMIRAEEGNPTEIFEENRNKSWSRKKKRVEKKKRNIFSG